MGVSHDEKQERQLDAERAVIGSLLIDSNIVPELLATVKSEDFQSEANKAVFLAAQTLYRDGQSVDAFTIRNQMGRQYGEFLAELIQVTPTSANWREYAVIMHQQATLVRIHELSDKLGLSTTMEDCRPVIADLEQLLTGSTTLRAADMSRMLNSFLDCMDPDAPAPVYIKTGYPWLDNGIYIHPGSYVIIGGEPSSGKTAMALSMAYHMSQERKVGFFSLETDEEQIRDRLISMAAKVDMARVQHRDLNDADCAAVAGLSEDFAHRQLTTVSAAGMTVDEISAASKAYGFDVIFVDYAQLIRPFDAKRNRSEQMAAVSMALHTFAQKSKTTVFALAQLSRPEKDKTKWRPPNMHDLKESGQFEADADLICLLYKPLQKENGDKHELRDLRVDKNKQGRRGTFHLAFDGPIQTFTKADTGTMAQNEYINAGKKAKAQRTAQAHNPAQMQILTDERSREEINRIFPADQGGFDAKAN